MGQESSETVPVTQPPAGLPLTEAGQSADAQTNAYQTTPSGAGDKRVTVLAPTESEGDKEAKPLLGNFGAYELLDQLGRGGMGVVYRARHVILNRVVALKTIKPDALGHSDKRVLRFVQEARVVAQMSHPNVVPLFEWGEYEGHHFFAMEFVPGGSLAQKRDHYIGQAQTVAALMEKVARGLHHAHERGILHRDLKPGNILLNEAGAPMISDFGLAKFHDSEVELTRSGDVVGTPSYMAPEQAAGRSAEVGVATDVWALGVILYELLTGRRPFPGPERQAIIQGILHADPPRPRSLNRGLDKALETITLKCLEKSPDRRYASAADLADDLARWQRGDQILARPPGLLGKTRRLIRRHPTISTALALALLFAAVATVLVATRQPSDPEKELKDIERRLAQGEKVPLIGPTGGPRWSNLVMQQGTVGTKETDKAFTLDSTELCLLELVRNPGQDHYLLSADVRHDDNKDQAESALGLYVGYSRNAASVGPDLSFVAFSFADPQGEQRDPKNEIPTMGRLILRRYGKTDNQPFDYKDSTKVERSLPAFPANVPTAERWRRLAIEVKPLAIEVFYGSRGLEDASIGEITRVELQKRAAQFLKLRPPVTVDLGGDFHAEFGPRDPLGIFVFRGRGSFKNVVIEPLK